MVCSSQHRHPARTTSLLHCVRCHASSRLARRQGRLQRGRRPQWTLLLCLICHPPHTGAPRKTSPRCVCASAQSGCTLACCALVCLCCVVESLQRSSLFKHRCWMTSCRCWSRSCRRIFGCRCEGGDVVRVCVCVCACSL